MSDESDVAGWNAFDEPTRAWLRKRLAEPALTDCFGDKIKLAGGEHELVKALRAGGAARVALLARRTGLSLDVALAQLDALAAQGAVKCDAGGFWEIAR